MVKLADDGVRATVEELEMQVEVLTRRLAATEKKVAEILALGEEFWRAEAAVLLVGATVTSWQYDVRDENILFTDVFPCEIFGEGQAKRWVGASGEITATIAITRAVPLVFSVRNHGFSSHGLADTLRLEIDGDIVPWSAKDGNFWSAEIGERAGHAQLNFRLAVDRSLIPAEKNVSFSFSELRIAVLSTTEPRRVRPPAIEVVSRLVASGDE